MHTEINSTRQERMMMSIHHAPLYSQEKEIISAIMASLLSMCVKSRGFYMSTEEHTHSQVDCVSYSSPKYPNNETRKVPVLRLSLHQITSVL